MQRWGPTTSIETGALTLTLAEEGAGTVVWTTRIFCAIAILASTTLFTATAFTQQTASPQRLSPPPMPLEVFGVPLGSGAAEIRALFRKRGYPQAGEGRYREQIAQIGDYTQTRYLSDIAGRKIMGRDYEEVTRFFFLPPPNENVVWAGGMISTFGGNTGPITASPLRTDVWAALVKQYGPPTYANDSTSEYGWYRDLRGVPLDKQRSYNCTVASIRAVPADPYIGIRLNAAVSDKSVFEIAQKNGCAFGFVAVIYHSKGYVTYFATRVTDFRAGAIGSVRTGQMLAQLKAGSDAVRSKVNRPDF